MEKDKTKKVALLVLPIALLLLVSLSYALQITAYVTVSGPDATPNPNIIYPENDADITDMVLIIVEDLSHEWDISSTTFEYSPNGIDWYTIGTEEDNPNFSIGALQVYWDTDSVESGTYQIRANITDNGGKRGTDEITVHVNKRPIAISTGTYVPKTDPLKVIFDASDSYDPDGTIVSYTWDFGDPYDPTPGSGKIVEHYYTKGGTYFVTLKVTDDAGFEGWGYYRLNFGIPCRNFLYAQTKQCECKNMTVNVTGMSAEYPGGTFKLGENNTVDLSKPGPYNLYFEFEVWADLIEGSDPKYCEEGQKVKATYRYSNETKDWKVDTTTCPYSGSTWCDDDYHKPGTYKVAEDLVIRWDDAPGWSENQKSQIPKWLVEESDFIWLQAAFEAFVKGGKDGSINLGECDCTWEVEMKVDQTGAEITPPRIFNLVCTVKSRPQGRGCPYVYTWNGKQYVMDNNLMPQVEIPNRTEVDVKDSYKLEKPLAKKKGKYYLLLKEFEQEHDYFDRVDLVAIDHDSSFKIAINPEGNILTYKDPVPPMSAVDQNGIDVLDKIESIDGEYYFGNEDDYIIVDFENVTAKEAKLVMKADFRYPMVYKSIHAQIQVEEDGEWYDVATILPRNYWATEIVDLSEHLSYLKDNFKIRLYFTRPHKLDFIGLDTSEQVKFNVRYATLESAVHSTQGDVKERLLTSDKNYAELLPNEQIELVFTLPKEQKGKEKGVRDFILFSHGHYDKIESTTTSTTTTPNPTCTCTDWIPTGRCCGWGWWVTGLWARTCTPSGCASESKCEGYCLVI